MTTVPGSEEGFRDLDPPGALLTLLQTAPLALRRRAPIPVFAVMLFGGVVLHAWAGYATNTAGLLAAVVSFFTVVERTDLPRSLAMTLVAAAGVALFYVTTREPIDNPWTEAVDVVGAFGITLLLGTFVRRRREQSAAERAHVALLEEEREALTQAAIADERASIARELHDAVGHALNLVVIQAGAAQRIIASQPERAAEALSAIESASRHALSDMDRMLGILREPSLDGAAGETAPGLHRLDYLIEQTREAGLSVEKIVEGAPTRIPQAVDRSAYRIVQEALTNALRHAGPAHAEVRVRYLRDALELVVTDDGAGSGASRNGGGRGLIGMRERVRLFSGELDAGPLPEGGFRVRARLPLGEAGR